ncbi:MAG: winged helix-turn-helix domain-containing protein, partial [bacterium]|nr:winged helix-turn-helix domain-containing protein [bacterium]
MAFIAQSSTVGRIEAICEMIDADAVYYDVVRFSDFDLSQVTSYDMLLIEPHSEAYPRIKALDDSLLGESEIALILIIAPESIDKLRMPSKIRSDFVCSTASDDELRVRISNLLSTNCDEHSKDFLRHGRLTVNLATYQVYVEGQALDLTYLEYKLLVFLMERPGKTYSREELLKYVWGLDYFGGSRTVDVHVRRLRAKLGP